MMICLCTAYLYTRLTTPIYKITAKLLVKDADVYEYQRYSKNFSSNMQTFGTMSMSEGVANEAEMIWSTQLMGEVVKHLKLYVNYKEEGRIKDRQVYATQPINVDLDSVHQDIMDRLAYEDFRTITMKMQHHCQGRAEEWARQGVGILPPVEVAASHHQDALRQADLHPQP